MMGLCYRCRQALLVGGLLLVAAGPASAHGTEKHVTQSAPDEHMQAMLAVKAQVPEAYRVMERTPVIPDAESLARGAVLFREHCAACHGEKGDGKGPAAAALPTPPANFLDQHHSSMYNPGEKFWIINNGGDGTGMPAFPGLSPGDCWHLVNHILALQQDLLARELFAPEKGPHH